MNKLEDQPKLGTRFGQESDPQLARKKAAQQEREARRESFMVKRSRPEPVLRPGPSLAVGADRAAFSQAWNEERRNAAKPEQSVDAKRNVARDAFKAQRRGLSEEARMQGFSRSTENAAARVPISYARFVGL